MSAVRRIAAATLAAGALAGATAAPASAGWPLDDLVIGPVCSAQLVAAEVGASDSCGFYEGTTDYATVTVVTDGTVTMTVSCRDGGLTRTTSRTFTETGTWTGYAVGDCRLTLTSAFPLTSAVATAAPMLNMTPVP